MHRKCYIGGMQDAGGMPIGFIATPFISCSNSSNMYELWTKAYFFGNHSCRQKDLPKLSTSAVKLARCSGCSSYINPFCEASTVRWVCCICGIRNNFAKTMVKELELHLSLDYLAVASIPPSRSTTAARVI
jgi:hypothetical protein